MRSFTIAVGVLGLLGSVGMGSVQARSQVSALASEQAPTEAERDVLIDKIARGEDYEKSVARFLVLQRELFAQRDAEKLAEQKEQEQQ